MMQWLCFYSAEHALAAQQLQQRMLALDVQLQLQQVALLNARFLRQHPEMCLILDEQGLWLAANGMKMQPAWHEELPRLKRASLKTEMLARACQMAKTQSVLDATAGLGHDGLLLAYLGAQVTLLERHPIVFALLEATWQRALQDPALAATANRMSIEFIDAKTYLNTLAPQQFDVIYLDPMFPARDANQKQDKKQAQVKKQMQLLHLLLPVDGIMDLGESLLDLAQQKALRVVVKRPKHAVFLAEQTPQHQWQGDACRFDGYFTCC